MLEGNDGCSVCRLVSSTVSNDGLDSFSLIHMHEHAAAEAQCWNDNEVGHELSIEPTTITEQSVASQNIIHTKHCRSM